MKITYFSASVLLLSVLCGCINLPVGNSQKTNIYDLYSAPEQSSKIPVTAGTFKSISPIYHKMMTRQGNKLIRDEFNQWVQPPQAMLTRYYQTIFPSNPGKNNWQLEGTILSFIRTSQPDTALLDVVYIVVSPDKKTRESLHLITKVPVKANSQEKFAEAMQEAVDSQRESLYKFLEKICKTQK